MCATDGDGGDAWRRRYINIYDAITNLSEAVQTFYVMVWRWVGAGACG